MEAEGICRGMSSAGRVRIARGSDGEIHTVAKQKYPKSRSPDIMSLAFCPLWAAAAVQLKGSNIETGIVLIGLDDVRLLRKNLSCVI